MQAVPMMGTNFQPKKSYGPRIKSQEPCTNSLATRNSDLGPGLLRSFLNQIWTLLKGVGLRMAGLASQRAGLLDCLAEAVKDNFVWNNGIIIRVSGVQVPPPLLTRRFRPFSNNRRHFIHFCYRFLKCLLARGVNA